MDNLDFIFRISAIILIIIRFVYWIITEAPADKEKPKKQPSTPSGIISRVGVSLAELFLVIQLFGLNLFTLPIDLNTASTGLFLIFLSVFLSILARHQLGNNWAHAAEYQIKKDHQLVTNGVYSYIRHPIYTAFALMFLGVELLVGSYLFYFFLIFMPTISYIQAKKEERILQEHFGKKYTEYKAKTKMFIPYIW